MDNSTNEYSEKTKSKKTIFNSYLTDSCLQSFSIYFTSSLAGLITGFVIVLRTTSFAAYIFQNPLISSYYQTLLHSMIWACIIAQIIYLFFCSHRSLVAGYSSTAAPIFALLVSDVLKENQPSQEVVSTIFFIFLFSALICGIVLYLLGRYGFASYLLFFPFPVIRGFWGGMGLSMMVGSYNIIAGQSLSLFKAESWILLFSGLVITKVVIVTVLGTFLRLIKIKLKKLFWFPLFCILILVVYWAIYFIFGFSYDDGIENGWVFDSNTSPSQGFWDFWILYNPVDFKFDITFNSLVNIASVLFITVIDMSINLPCLSDICTSEVDFDKEMKTAGISCFFCGLLGSAGPSYMTLSPSKINSETGGGYSYLSGIFILIFYLVFFFAGSSLLSIFPPIFVATLLFYAGIAYFLEGVFDTYFLSMTRMEYGCIWLIVIFSIFWDLVIAVGLGTFFAFFVFIIEYSKKSSVESYDLKDLKEIYPLNSSCELLIKYSEQFHIIFFRDFLFFGSIPAYSRIIKNKLALNFSPYLCRYFVFDFHHVMGIDSSAQDTLLRLISFIIQQKGHVHFSGFHHLKNCSKLNEIPNVLYFDNCNKAIESFSQYFDLVDVEFESLTSKGINDNEIDILMSNFYFEDQQDNNNTHNS